MELPAIEDERGVDVSQIEALLRMSVQERVAFMVRAANTMMEIQRHARTTRENPRPE